MRLAELVLVSEQVGATPARLRKIALLAALLRRLAPDEIEPAVGFLSGTPRQGRIGVGWATLRDQTSAGPPAEQPVLELGEVDLAFERLKGVAGKGSAATRAALLGALLDRATAAERRFLGALTLGEIRQGALEGVLAEAVAQAAGFPAGRVRRAAMLAGDIGVAARAVLLEGERGLDRYRLECFRPVQPMLADSAPDVADALARLGRAALELKLDGARVQVHKAGAEVRVYTRNLNEVTPAVPEVVDAVRSLPAQTAILDGEVVALGPRGRPEPFQVTMRRFGRRLDVERLQGEIPLTPFFFDLLLLDGVELVDRPQSERFERLARLAPPALVVPALVTGDLEEAQGFFQRALDAGHEGVMAKAPDAPYDAGRRGQAWLKVKQARTLDLVVLAAEWGSGRRRGWLSNLHLGAAAPDRDGFVMLGKTFKGLTDEMLRWQTRELLAREVRREGNTVFVRPELVAEIAFNDLQESPHYPGGLALRFARVKGYRPDKTADQADAFTTVQRLYREATGREPPELREAAGS